MYLRHLIGIDIGTSGLKASLIDEAGQHRAAAFREYAPELLQPGWAEQDPEAWLQAAISAVCEVLRTSDVEPQSIAGLSFSGQMHSTVFLDSHQHAIRPAILWLDTRSAPQVAAFKHALGQAQLAEWIGNPLMPGFMLSSLLWVKAVEPETWARLKHVLLAKDYVRLRLTGDLATDFSDASSTALLDVQHRMWCEELLRAADIPLAWLPPLMSSVTLAGHLRPDVAAAMNLPAGLPVMCGAGDQEAQAVGNGILRPGCLSSTIGTGGQLFAPLDHYRSDPQLRIHTFCHALPDLWHWQAATLTAGASLRWLRDEVLGGRYSYQELADAAASVNPGAEGLLFKPYLAGERTPHMNPDLRGSFNGLTLRHSWKHLARAVMEGVVFSLYDGLELMRGLGAHFDEVIASGGGTRHPLWLQLQADVFGLPVRRTQTPEAAAFGAALLAGVGVGVFDNIAQACERCVRWSEEVFEPRAEPTRLYHEQIQHWHRMAG